MENKLINFSSNFLLINIYTLLIIQQYSNIKVKKRQTPNFFKAMAVL